MIIDTRLRLESEKLIAEFVRQGFEQAARGNPEFDEKLLIRSLLRAAVDRAFLKFPPAQALELLGSALAEIAEEHK